MELAPLACRHCGAQNAPGATRCAACGAPLVPTNTMPGHGGSATPSPFAKPARPASEPSPEPTPGQVTPLPPTAQTQPGLGTPGANVLPPVSTESAAPLLEALDEVDPQSDGAFGPQTEEVDRGFQPGDLLLSHYRVVKKLGHGGMGTVYLAEHDLSHQRVAVKVLPAALAREKGIRERFTQEAQALASLDHPNIVPLVTYAAEGDDRFLVMKFVDGKALDVLIHEKKKLDFATAEKVFRALVSALGYAHARGVIHRDVKPANLIVSEDGRIFLVDFGIAKREQSTRLTQTGMLMGTPQYMSPEQISGHPIDGRSDFYAAGLILFEMLTGRPPFQSEKTFAILRAHVEEKVPDPVKLRGESIPSHLLNATSHLLDKDPNQRPSTAEGVLALLDDKLADVDHSFFSEHTDPTIAVLERSGEHPTTLTPDVGLGMSSGDGLDEIDRALAASVRPRRGLAAMLTLLAVLAAGGVAWAIGPGGVFEPGGLFAPKAETFDADAAAQRVLLDKAEERLKTGDADAAKALLDVALSENPKNAYALIALVDVHLLNKDRNKAKRLFDRLDGALVGTTGEIRARLDRQQKELTALEDQAKASWRKRAEARKKQREREIAARAKLPDDLTNAQINKVTGGKKASARLQTCWEETVLRKDADAKGRIRLELTVVGDGNVKRVKVIQRTVGSTRFEKCVVKTAKGWRFPKFRGADIIVDKTFHFSGKG